MKASWHDAVIATSDNTIVVEGNHYFPRESVNADHLQASETQTVCPWKGTAHYFHVVVDGKVNEDAAWYYPETKAAAARIRGQIAFWKGVTVA